VSVDRKPKKKKKKVRKVAPGEDNPGVEVTDGPCEYKFN